MLRPFYCCHFLFPPVFTATAVARPLMGNLGRVYARERDKGRDGGGKGGKGGKREGGKKGR